MSKPIEFYFDFSSPYGYLTAQAIDDLGKQFDREVIWKPILLGAVFRVTGQRPLLEVPLKGRYAAQDMERGARSLGVPFEIPAAFPFSSVAAARAFYWRSDRDPASAKALAKAFYSAAFGQGRDLTDTEVLLEIAESLGIDSAEMAAAFQDQTVKDRLRREVDQAIEREVFGSPFLIVDGERFWGHDKLPEIARWLQSGGW